MNYDVFISYSRADLSQIEPLVKEIERRANVTCWIDWNGIESGAQFEDVIIKAIDSVSVVLFFVSESSMSSQYAKMEVNYAYNTKKKVVPVVLDGGTLRGWFLFKFGAVDYIDIREPRQYDKLIQNLQAWCGTTDRSASTVQTSSQSATSASVLPHFVPKTYRIGDFYDDGKKQGVVFEVDATGTHGKIVSLTQSEDELLWCSWEEYEREIETGASDKTNGMNNQRKIAQISNWREKYPAFAWCADRGEEWYLPAIEELKTLLLNDAVHDAVNRTLEAKGATKLYNKGESRVWYWASTEHDYTGSRGWKFCAWHVDMDRGYTYNLNKNFYSLYVRAVSAF